MRVFQDINRKIYLRTVCLMSVLFTVSFFFAFAKSEGEEGAVYTVMSFPAQVFGIPFFWLFVQVFHVQNPISFLIGVGLDVLLLALIMERLFYFLNLVKKSK